MKLFINELETSLYPIVVTTKGAIRQRVKDEPLRQRNNYCGELFINELETSLHVAALVEELCLSFDPQSQHLLRVIVHRRDSRHVQLGHVRARQRRLNVFLQHRYLSRRNITHNIEFSACSDIREKYTTKV